MVKKSYTGRPSDVRKSRYPAEAPHFHKIIKSPEVQLRKLRIPSKFARKYGRELSNIVFLWARSGAVWQVELTDRGGRVWLDNGWEKFVECYSIRYGHLLVFRYDGDSNFQVRIFDMIAEEYSVETLDCKTATENTSKSKEIGKDVPIEISDDDQTGENVSKREKIEKDVSYRKQGSYEDFLSTHPMWKADVHEKQNASSNRNGQKEGARRNVPGAGPSIAHRASLPAITTCLGDVLGVVQRLEKNQEQMNKMPSSMKEEMRQLKHAVLGTGEEDRWRKM